LAVCSAVKVNVAVVAAFSNASPVAVGRLTLKHRVSAAAGARLRSPGWAPWALSPMSAPAVESRSPE
jgi:hypothetical protein